MSIPERHPHKTIFDRMLEIRKERFGRPESNVVSFEVVALAAAIEERLMQMAIGNDATARCLVGQYCLCLEPLAGTAKVCLRCNHVVLP